MKMSVPVVHKICQWIWMMCGMLLRLVDVMNLILTLSHPPVEVISFEKKITNKQKKTLLHWLAC